MEKQSTSKRYNEIMLGLMFESIDTLHQFGYADADAENIFTTPMYASFFNNNLKETKEKAVTEDVKMLCTFLMSKITCKQ